MPHETNELLNEAGLRKPRMMSTAVVWLHDNSDQNTAFTCTLENVLVHHQYPSAYRKSGLRDSLLCYPMACLTVQRCFLG